ncbi:metallophosphoesterase [Alsobacter soli]|uniref:Metallophosphoesterase n=1 Tax=Alsobacter soli TaxID=2109933 RepID=A0A2T1HR39_9HYPH|nr:metallophosphoesterase [Alsobacter soli]
MSSRAILDPREGDVEDDAASTKTRSLLAIGGALISEISFPKLALAWVLLIALPAVVLGATPLVAKIWFVETLDRISAVAGIGSALILALVAGVGWFGLPHLLRVLERSFWSLNSIAVQPGYVLAREVLRHVLEGVAGPRMGEASRARLRAGTSAAAGGLSALVALALIAMAWPYTRWTGELADLAAPLRLVKPALANAVVLVSACLAVASLAWGVADAAMDQLQTTRTFDEGAQPGRTWRVAHLSDIHVVGEEYGFRIESGRAGPRGNRRLDEALHRLERLHAARALDHVLITGDMTDAGRAGEWAAFMTALSRRPALAERTLILPGNHDLNIADRGNPARLDLPTSPGKRLRQMRALSAMDAVQGARVRVVDRSAGKLGPTLTEFLRPHRASIAAFADTGSLRLSRGLESLWENCFPMILPPAEPDGLGVALLNSNAETHFSFTNALGLVPALDARALLSVMEHHGQASWIVALHHHLLEYPTPAKALSERIGTALINGSWFIRQLAPFASRAIAMHGHRHVDWIGSCGRLRIVSAPSPVMEARDDEPTCFYIHELAAGAGALRLLAPEQVVIGPRSRN